MFSMPPLLPPEQPWEWQDWWEKPVRRLLLHGCFPISTYLDLIYGFKDIEIFLSKDSEMRHWVPHGLTQSINHKSQCKPQEIGSVSTHRAHSTFPSAKQQKSEHLFLCFVILSWVSWGIIKTGSGRPRMNCSRLQLINGRKKMVSWQGKRTSYCSDDERSTSIGRRLASTLHYSSSSFAGNSFTRIKLFQR